MDDDSEETSHQEDSEQADTSSTSLTSSSGSESDAEQDIDEDPEDDSVDVTLEFFDPKESDFQGLKALLQSFLDGAAFAVSELVDTIINQVSL